MVNPAGKGGLGRSFLLLSYLNTHGSRMRHIGFVYSASLGYSMHVRKWTLAQSTFIFFVSFFRRLQMSHRVPRASTSSMLAGFRAPIGY